MAAQMMTKQEKKWKTISVFDTFAWMDRKRVIRERLAKKRNEHKTS